MKFLLEIVLHLFARAILKKYHPKVVAVTGSVGKTSAKEAIFAVLKNHFDVWRNPSNYNNELGVPLTIIGAKTGGRSLFKWFCVFFKALYLLVLPCRYPKVLILEMGADHPGDIEKLVKFARPTISVVTAVCPVHLEFFGTLKRVAEEKGKIIECLPKEGVAILNYDDEMVFAMGEKTGAKIMTFGFKEGATVGAIEMSEHLELGVIKDKALGGVIFKIRYAGSVVPIFLSNVLGKQHVYAALSGAAVGLALDLNLVEISEGLKQYQAPRGRMQLVKGIKETMIIDDTYNSSPWAALEALEVLGRFGKKEETRRIAVLGDMLELGKYTEEGHRKVGRRCAQMAELVVAVGERAAFLADESLKAGIQKENVFHFHTAKEAGHFLQGMIKSGDILLVKGSQGMRMERVVRELMAEPLKAEELLVRQGKEWL
jgi:UDP-N-acetylmuramoyl-tripeptide--D-alanyl-D-alanine ligase